MLSAYTKSDSDSGWGAAPPIFPSFSANGARLQHSKIGKFNLRNYFKKLH